MDGSINYAEYTVTQKAEGKFLKRKILWLAVYGLIIFAYIGLMVKLSNYGVLVAILTVPFIPMTVMVVRYFTWNRFVKIEHRYEVVNAKLRITEVYRTEARGSDIRESSVGIQLNRTDGRGAPREVGECGQDTRMSRKPEVAGVVLCAS